MNTKIIWQRSRTVMQQFFDILFPVHCAGCQCSGHVLCPSCIAQIHPLPSPICQHCGAPLPPGGKSETPSDESRGVLAEISTFPKILEGSAALVPSRQDVRADTLRLREYRSGAGNPAHSHVLGSLPGRPTSTPPCFASECPTGPRKGR